MTATLNHTDDVVPGFPLAPIIFPFLWLFVDTSRRTPRLRVGIPVIFPFLWRVLDDG